MHVNICMERERETDRERERERERMRERETGESLCVSMNSVDFVSDFSFFFSGDGKQKIALLDNTGKEDEVSYLF